MIFYSYKFSKIIYVTIKFVKNYLKLTKFCKNRNINYGQNVKFCYYFSKYAK